MDVQLAFLLQLADNSMVIFLTDNILPAIDPVAQQNEDQRQDEHKNLDGQLSARIEDFSSGVPCLNSRKQQAEAGQTHSHGAADFIDEGLDRESDALVAFAQLELAVFHGIREEHQHQKLNESLADKEEKGGKTD